MTSLIVTSNKDIHSGHHASTSRGSLGARKPAEIYWVLANNVFLITIHDIKQQNVVAYCAGLILCIVHL